MPYFSFLLSLPLWYADQMKKLWEDAVNNPVSFWEFQPVKVTPEGVKTPKTPE